MLQQLYYHKLLVQRLLIVLLLFTLCRILFFAFNYSFFQSISFIESLSVLFHGIRFDLPVILYANLLFILMHLLPHPYRLKNWYQMSLKIQFYVLNAVLLLPAVIDFKYFQFILKRTTSDIFSMKDDIISLIPDYLKDYWYLLIIYILLIGLMVTAYEKIKMKKSFSKENYWLQFLLLIFSSGLVLLGIRGGIQLRPMLPIDAFKYAKYQFVPLVTNTPMTLLYSIEHEKLVEKNYFPQDSLQNYFSILHEPDKSNLQPFNPHNVCIIILESFSKEYFHTFTGNESYVPFLDSLIQQSLTFEYSFANGKKSVEAVPSILCGIPALSNEPYIFSDYYDNKINSLASCLNQKGYSTAFFHGANNGSMGFDNFSQIAGFQKFYGRNEYNNDKDFDGHWGIFDEPFFQFTAGKMKTMSKPFLVTLFSISSHHPYSLPAHLKGKFKKGPHQIFEVVNYTDFALRKFFQTISKETWFDSTLFIITADHVGETVNNYYYSRLGMYSIPIIFYQNNSSLKGEKNIVIQQADIVPSALDYLHYDYPYVAFGKSIFDTAGSHFAINYLNNSYQFVNEKYVLHFDREKSKGLFEFRTDPFLQKNLLQDKIGIATMMENETKAIIQSYNYSVIHNKLSVR